MVETRSFPYKKSEIAYSVFGNGATPVICFHGYGESSESFLFLEKYAGDRFHFIAFDLPFHGRTIWRENEFSNDDLLSVIKELLIINDIDVKNPNAVLLGFSLGGRIALGLYELIPASISRLVLMAPDGMKVNFWYWLSTQTSTGKSLFSFTMKNPGWFFGFLKLINGLGMVNRSIFKFVNYYIGDAKVREELYNRWTILSKIKPSLKKIKRQIKEYKTRVRLIYGKHDRIILTKPGERFCNGIEANCRISIIHAGHQVLHENHVEEIMPCLVD
jgi:pimeloyl-ACP methyl ester carboxylesterase